MPAETCCTLSPALTKPRDPRIARQLAWCSPGLGHMYAGSLVRGLWIMTLGYMPLSIASITLLRDCISWPLVVICSAASLLFYIWSVWDAVKVASLTRADYRMKDYNRTSAYLMLFLTPSTMLGVAIAMVLFIKVGGSIRFGHSVPELGFSSGDLVGCSKLAYRVQSPAKNDRVAFRFSPTSPAKTPGLVLAVAGETIPSKDAVKIVPPDHVWIRFLDNVGKYHNRIVSTFAVEGKIAYRFWPPSRFGRIPDGTSR